MYYDKMRTHSSLNIIILHVRGQNNHVFPGQYKVLFLSYAPQWLKYQKTLLKQINKLDYIFCLFMQICRKWALAVRYNIILFRIKKTLL